MAKKNFFPDLEEEKSAALSIINPKADTEPEPYSEDPQPTIIAPSRPSRRTETKSKRMQILIKPSLYDKLRRIADAEGTSMNDIINSIIEGYQE